MDDQKQDDQLEPIYNSSVPIQDIALKTSLERRTIKMGDERGSGGSVLAARHDNDVCTQFNVFNYCFVSLTIQLNLSDFLHTIKW